MGASPSRTVAGDRPIGHREPVLCSPPMAHLLFATHSVVYDHPELLAAVRSGDDLSAPPSVRRPPEGGLAGMLRVAAPSDRPGHRGLASSDQVQVGAPFVPMRGTTLPPGFTPLLRPSPAALAVPPTRHPSRVPTRRGASRRLRDLGLRTDAAPTGAPTRHSTPTWRPGAPGSRPHQPDLPPASRARWSGAASRAETSTPGTRGAMPVLGAATPLRGCLSDRPGAAAASQERITARPPRGDGRGGHPPLTTAREQGDDQLRQVRGRAAAPLEGDRACHPVVRAGLARLDPRQHNGSLPGPWAPSATPASTRSHLAQQRRPISTRPTTGPPATGSPTWSAPSRRQRQGRLRRPQPAHFPASRIVKARSGC